MARTALIVAAVLALLAAAIGFKGELVSAPDLRAVEAGSFDTPRALARLRRILGDERPHPVDSAANDAVRQRLLEELRAIGLDPVVTDEFVCNGSKESRSVACARVRNIVATIGPADGRHVLLVSHYDSTPVGPGAADDGIGVAAMLEAAAVLKNRRLSRPVTFLFNEGEETGLLGARAFLERNPIAAKVDALLNLESRGTTGPAIMFETSRPNGAAIAAYGQVARPAANALTTDFYRLIPNSTDVSVFEERPWTILNFAIIGNETRYHSPGDSLAALDPRSLDHMGVQAVAAAEALANGAVEAGGEQLYADLLGIGFIILPAWIGLAFLWALILAYGWLAWTRRGGIARGAAATAAAMVDAALTVFIVHVLIGWLRPEGEYWRAHPGLISLAIDLTAIASAAAALLWVARPIARDALRLGYWLAFLALGAMLSLIAPGSAIFFLGPPLVALGGLLAPRYARTAQLFALAILFFSWVPLLHLSQVLLDFDAAWSFAPVSVLILLPWLIELKPDMAKLGRGRVTAALAVAAVLGWLPAALAPAYSIDAKQRMSLEYVWDADARESRLMVYHDRGRLPAAFGDLERDVEVPWSNYDRWARSLRGPPLPPPELEKLMDRQTPQGRLVRLRLRTRGAEVVRVRAEPEARLLAVQAAGAAARRFGKGGDEEDYGFRCHGRSCDGLVFDLLLRSTAPVELTVMGVSTGLPTVAAGFVAARPKLAQPQYGADAAIALGRLKI
jgi:hypothetical protein